MAAKAVMERWRVVWTGGKSLGRGHGKAALCLLPSDRRLANWISPKKSFRDVPLRFTIKTELFDPGTDPPLYFTFYLSPTFLRHPC